VRSHPFVDGNPRATRLLAGLIYLAAQEEEPLLATTGRSTGAGTSTYFGGTTRLAMPPRRLSTSPSPRSAAKDDWPLCRLSSLVAPFASSQRSESHFSRSRVRVSSGKATTPSPIWATPSRCGFRHTVVLTAGGAHESGSSAALNFSVSQTVVRARARSRCTGEAYTVDWCEAQWSPPATPSEYSTDSDAQPERTPPFANWALFGADGRDAYRCIDPALQECYDYFDELMAPSRPR